MCDVGTQSKLAAGDAVADCLRFYFADRWSSVLRGYLHGDFIGWDVDISVLPKFKLDVLQSHHMDLVLIALVMPDGEWECKDAEFERGLTLGVLERLGRLCTSAEWGPLIVYDTCAAWRGRKLQPRPPPVRASARSLNAACADVRRCSGLLSEAHCVPRVPAVAGPQEVGAAQGRDADGSVEEHELAGIHGAD
ncbi:MAG: hypothetical protein QOI06_2249 [Nocardioidaceae bacterium]|nr:hypothetical protein [Nocardioidaceae bacterium]